MNRSPEQGKTKRAIYACDIGAAHLGNFAWARVEPDAGDEILGSSNICSLVNRLKEDLRYEYSVALGFEAPLFIPVPESADDLSKGRQGEGNRSFAAPIGGFVTTLGMHQAAWVLRKIFLSHGKTCAFTLDPENWPPTMSRQSLFCWEAFVAGTAHSKSGEQAHLKDAATAAMEFLCKEDQLMEANAVTAKNPFSLIGAVALWSGWTADIQMLRHEHTLVIKPMTPYEGPIEGC